MYKCCVFEIENGGVGTLEKIKTLGGSMWKGSSSMLLQFVFATLCCMLYDSQSNSVVSMFHTRVGILGRTSTALLC